MKRKTLKQRQQGFAQKVVRNPEIVEFFRPFNLIHTWL
jgi:hypothetical protein